MDSSEIALEAVSSVSQIPAEDWDACANPAAPPDRPGAQAFPAAAGRSAAGSTAAYNPFVSHAFFSAVEASGSASSRTGWAARHLVARLDGEIAGIVPCYLKSHSQGEYVFDRGWAEAYQRAGGQYYPKLQVSVPFTPATGRRLLVPPSPDADRVREALIAGLLELCRKREASSVHFTFLPEQNCQALVGHGFLHRTDQQFHWQNNSYVTFDAFLEA